MLSENIAELVNYGLQTGLLPECEKIYATNLLLEEFGEKEYAEPEEVKTRELEKILQSLNDEAVKRGIIEDGPTSRDLFDTKLMNCLMPRPSQVIGKFEEKFKAAPKEATDWFYKLSGDSNYIRRYRIARDKKWTVDSEYGKIDITINLSKPEKDPKAIAAAGKVKSVSYPKCQLCVENEGYAGRLDHPARENHRIIPVNILGEEWGFQYSPYVYYNEHCILFNKKHTPMKIDRSAFEKLLDFVRQFPHYMIGSNADLPIVGGSILSHEHFQGGNYTFAMAKAPFEKEIVIPGYADVTAGILKWPMSVIRIRHKDARRLVELADHILQLWRGYSDEEAFVFAETEGEKHNTITPIARKNGEEFELDLVLRNNITTKEHPLGVFHPHEKLHHIKKENIGLIEVMGLAVLPARLKGEMEVLKKAILAGEDLAANAETSIHAEWATEFLARYDEVTESNIDSILEQEIGKVFTKVLEDAGVYKCTEEGREAFLRFIATL